MKPWARLDDDHAHHPKIVAAGPIAELLHKRSISHANHFLTDGFIDAATVSRLLAGLKGITVYDQPAEEIDWAAIMVRHRLWDAHEGG